MQQFYPSAVRAATFTGDAIRRDRDAGIKAVLDVTAVPGVDTVQLVLQENIGPPGQPAAANWVDLASATASAATGRQALTVHPCVTAVANRAISDSPLNEVRARVVHSAGTTFTYSLYVESVP